MAARWMSAYAYALREQDPAKVEDLCEEARRAIHTRMLELEDTRADVHERGELEEALRQLTIHKYRRPRAS